MTITESATELPRCVKLTAAWMLAFVLLLAINLWLSTKITTLALAVCSIPVVLVTTVLMVLSGVFSVVGVVSIGVLLVCRAWRHV